MHQTKPAARIGLPLFPSHARSIQQQRRTPGYCLPLCSLGLQGYVAFQRVIVLSSMRMVSMHTMM